MHVSYTYRSDEPPPEDEIDGKRPSATPAKTAPELKTFSFCTVVDLATIVPREDVRTEASEP